VGQVEDGGGQERGARRSEENERARERDERRYAGRTDVCAPWAAHAASRGDEQIVYDNQRHRVSLSDTHLDILPGLAHLSDVAFSPEGQV
jgi:hypothetical protein